jgi:hypothetical protein
MRKEQQETRATPNDKLVGFARVSARVALGLCLLRHSYLVWRFCKRRISSSSDDALRTGTYDDVLDRYVAGLYVIFVLLVAVGCG